jgi:putative membrane protein
MMLRVALAALHLLALGIGLGAVWTRGRALRQRPLDLAAVRRAFVADTWWGIAAALWIITGVWRVLAGMEKPAQYYLHNHAFYAKMGLLAAILILEIWPMVTLIRWRIATSREGDLWKPDESVARRIGTISYVEAALILAMVVAATAMARGVGG